jgi:hypothetical protein
MLIRQQFDESNYLENKAIWIASDPSKSRKAVLCVATKVYKTGGPSYVFALFPFTISGPFLGIGNLRRLKNGVPVIHSLLP